MSENHSSYCQNITSIEDNREKLADERAAIQKKTFTKWVNSHLNKSGHSIENLFTDLRSGINLAHLVDILTNSSLLKSTGRTPFHALQNITGCLEHLKNFGVKLVNIRTEDIHDGNPKLTLGLIWTLILHFELSFIRTKIDQTHYSGKSSLASSPCEIDNNNQVNKENVSGNGNDKEATTVRGALLRWAQQCVGDDKSIPISNFTSSWKDGKALCGIISNRNPEALPKDVWMDENTTPKERLKLAFDTANKLYDVPCLLDPEDVDCENPDDKSIITYLSLLCHSLSSKSPKDLPTHDDKVREKVNECTDKFFNMINSFKDKPSTIKTDLLKQELEEHTKLVESMESMKQDYIGKLLSCERGNISSETSEHIKKAEDFVEKSIDFAKTRLYELQEAFELCDSLNENVKSINEWLDSFFKSMNELKESIPECDIHDIDAYEHELENRCESIKHQSDFLNVVMERVDKFFGDHDNQNTTAEIDSIRSHFSKKFEEAWGLLNTLAEEFDGRKVEQLHESFTVLNVSSDDKIAQDAKIFNEKVNQMDFFMTELETIMNRLEPIMGSSHEQIQSELSEINDILIKLDEKTFIMKELRKHMDNVKNDYSNSNITNEDKLLSDLEKRWEKLTSFFKTRSSELDSVLLKHGNFNQVIEENINWIDSIQKSIDSEDVKYSDVKIIDLEICRLKVLGDDIKNHETSIIDIKNSLPGQMYLVNDMLKKVVEMSGKYDKLRNSWNDKYQDLEFMKEEALSILDMFEDIKMRLVKFEQKLMLPQPLPALENNVVCDKEKFDKLYTEFIGYKESTLKEIVDKSSVDPRVWYRNNVAMLSDQFTKLEKDFEEKKIKLEKALEHGKKITKTIDSLTCFVENAEEFIENINTESRSLQVLSQELTTFDAFVNDLNIHKKTFKNLEKLSDEAVAVCDKKDAIALKNDIVKIGQKMSKIDKKKQEKYGILKTKQTDVSNFHDNLIDEVTWIKNTMVNLSNFSVNGGNSNEIQSLMEKFNIYRNEIKDHNDSVSKLITKGLKIESEALNNEKKNYRDDVDKLTSLWSELKDLSERIYHELQESLNKKEKHNDRINKYITWCVNNINTLEKEVNEGKYLGDIESVSKIEKEHKFVQDDFNIQKAFIEDELVNLTNDFNDPILRQLDGYWSKLKDLISKKESLLKDVKDKAIELDKKYKNLIEFLDDTLKQVSSSQTSCNDNIKEQINVFKKLGDQLENKKNEFIVAESLIKKYLPEASSRGKENLLKMLETLSHKWNEAVLKNDEKQCIYKSDLEVFETLKKALDENKKMIDEYKVELGRLDNPKDIAFLDDHEFAQQQYLLIKSDIDNHRCLINGLFKSIDELADNFIGKEILSEDKEKLSKEWLCIQQKCFTYGEDLSSVKNDIVESNNLSNFTFTEWRNRYIKWHDLGKLRINDLFRNFDDKGTGYLTREEIISPFLLSSFKTNKKEMEKVADVFDEGNNMINVKKFLQALKVPSDKTSALKTEKEIIEKVIISQSQQCKCSEKYKIEKISTTEDGVIYSFGNDGTFKRFIRILQFSIMVRVGGGWVTLDKFLETHDPCRMERKTNAEIYGIGKKLPHTVARMENFHQKRHNSHNTFSNRPSIDNTPVRRPLSRQTSKIPVFTKPNN
uniref:Calponin-homology (CH) domain-containing protein n=1 Tax=Strongyloides papillosus TaxID=174720 RepID=A0A0N5CHX2_STREA